MDPNYLHPWRQSYKGMRTQRAWFTLVDRRQGNCQIIEQVDLASGQIRWLLYDQQEYQREYRSAQTAKDEAAILT